MHTDGKGAESGAQCIMGSPPGSRSLYLTHFEKSSLFVLCSFCLWIASQFPGLCGHHAMRLILRKITPGQEGKGGGRRGRTQRREETEEGSCCRQR